MKKKNTFLCQLALSALLLGTVTSPVAAFANEGIEPNSTTASSTSSSSQEEPQASTSTSSLAVSTTDSSVASSASSSAGSTVASSTTSDSSSTAVSSTDSDTSSTDVSTATNSSTLVEETPATTPAPTQPAASEPASGEEVQEYASGIVTIYRLYNKNNGEHLYTSDANEKNVLFRQHGWGYEGEAWYAPAAGQGTPVYRLYNAGLENHLYTTDVNEVKILTTKHGWVKDNGGRPVFYSGGSAKIYRVYNRELRGLHHWTTDQNEYKVLPQHGWQQEGVKFYGISVGVPIRTQYYDGLPSGSSRIDNINAYAAIEADVTLTGTGTGYHAKLTMNTPTSAISFGIQYDSAARAPHTGKASFMVENIGHNFAGGQSYQWSNLYANNPGATYHLMLAYHQNGTYIAYINGAEVLRGTNTALAGQELYLRVEGAARKTGDSINATFSNIRLKNNNQYIAGRTWTGTPRFNISNGLSTLIDGQTVGASAAYDRAVTKSVTIRGTLNNLPAAADWDTAGWFDKVSGLVQFY